MEIPIRLNVVKELPEENIFGRTSRISTPAVHIP
jgi:hypothetical protein